MDLNLLVSLSLEKRYDTLVRHLHDLKSKNYQINQNDLEPFLCAPGVHSLLFIFMIEKVPWPILQKPFCSFLISFDVEQVSHAMKRFNDVVEDFVKFAVENNFGVKIIRPLYFAIKKLESFGLSPLNVLYLQLCLRLKMYKEAYKMAIKPIGSLMKKTG